MIPRRVETALTPLKKSLFRTGLAVCGRLLARAAFSPFSTGRTGAVKAPVPALRAPGVPSVRRGSRPAQAFLLVLLLVVPSLAVAVPGGTPIANTARADYAIGGLPAVSVSNSVSFITTEVGTAAVMGLYTYAPSGSALTCTVMPTAYFDTTTGTWLTAPSPSHPTLGPVPVGGPVPLAPAAVFTVGEPVFVVLSDPDQDTDPAVADTVVVTVRFGPGADEERIVLSETGPDTGLFTGYVRSGPLPAILLDGVANATAGATATVSYTDPTDPSDTASSTAVFDPSGVLFLAKEAGRSKAGVGDFVGYTVSVRNTSATPLPAVTVEDVLPPGFRYRSGSTRVNGIFAADPALSADGRTLSFAGGALAPAGSVSVSYVAEVGAGARPGAAVNRARATAGQVVSNTAGARVLVRDDLFNRSSFIAGQVATGACGEEVLEGVGGVRVFLEDGTFAVTDPKGRYHFEGVSPGAHVVQLDLETVAPWLEVVDCETNTRSAGRSWSRFVDLSAGSLWRVDFVLSPKPKEQGRTFLELRSVADEGGARYQARLRGEAVPVRNVRFVVVLPDGVDYAPGTSRLEQTVIPDPVQEGNTLTWNLGDMPVSWEKGVTFETRVREGWEWAAGGTLTPIEAGPDQATTRTVTGRMHEVYSRAHLVFDTPEAPGVKTPVIDNLLLKVAEQQTTQTRKFIFRPHFATFAADLTEEDRVALDIIARQFEPSGIRLVQVTGHTDDVPIAERSHGIYADNYELSRARARTVAEHLAGAWGLPSAIFSVDGKGPDAPIDSNGTEEGRGVNRRVEVGVVTEEVVRSTSLEPVRDYNTTEVEIVGLRPGQKWEAPAEPSAAGGGEPPDLTKDLAWLESDTGSLRFAMPAEGFLPAQPGVKVAVVHGSATKARLYLNGEEVSQLNFDSRTTNRSGTAAMSFWRGVHMREGDNVLEAAEVEGSGREKGRTRLKVHYSGEPTALEFLPAQSTLAADGRTPPVIAVRLTDAQGYPARRGVIGQFDVQAPHRSLERAEERARNPLGGGGATYSTFRVGEAGVVRIPLAPTTATGPATVRLKLSDGWRELTVRLSPEMRDWILVGLAEGTAGYNLVSGSMEAFESAGGEEPLTTDGRIALYAKGRIRGDHLLTLAYDTDKERQVGGGLREQTVDPDTYYTLYGDASEQGHDAASKSKLYLKIERGAFYALFGDYDTGLTVTELGRYSRRMTGAKSEMASGGFSYNVFASESGQAFAREELPGDGTCGLYRLRYGRMVPNSETVRIEVRDRFRSEVVLSARELARHTDYNVDYMDGTLYFREPVAWRDASFNPVFAVVDYETEDPEADGITWGGRGSYRNASTGAEAGVTLLSEDRGLAGGELAALDVTVPVSPDTRLRIEAARSVEDSGASETKAGAYVANLLHEGGRFKASLFVREIEEGFGLGHQSAAEAGMRKAGVDARYAVTETLGLKVSLLEQENTVTEAERSVRELGLVSDTPGFGYDLGIRTAEDTFVGGSRLESNQATAGVRWSSADARWSLKGRHDQSVGDNDNPDYPTRTGLEAEYRLNRAVSFTAEQEVTSGEESSTAATRLGVKATPWEGGEATGRVAGEANEDGDRLYANLGLVQRWQVTPVWKVSAGLERSETLDGPSVPSLAVNPEAPPASGGEDYTAVSLGTEYAFGIWRFNARVETRRAETGDKAGLLSDLFGEPSPGVGLSAALRHFTVDSDGGTDTVDSSLRLGYVYRPLGGRWTVLERLDLIEEEDTGTAESCSRRIVNNLNANLRADDDSQYSFQLGAKRVKDLLEGQAFTGSVYLAGFESRHDLSDRWDIGVRASLLDSADAGQTDYGLGLSAGWSFGTNVWVSFGYNLLGFVDEDFSDGGFTAQGPFVKFRLRLDQASLRDLLK